MPTFAFTGRTRSGENIAGERVADTIDAVTAMLRREQVLGLLVQVRLLLVVVLNQRDFELAEFAFGQLVVHVLLAQRIALLIDLILGQAAVARRLVQPLMLSEYSLRLLALGGGLRQLGTGLLELELLLL